MEFADRTRERSTVIMAVLTLVVIGLVLLVSTWQTMRHQRDAEEQHLFLSTRAVLLAVESSLRRGPVRTAEDRLTPRTAEFFEALERDGDVLFAGIIDPQGGRLLTSSMHGGGTVELPGPMVQELFDKGEWHGRLDVGGRTAYVYGKQLAPLRGMHGGMHVTPGPQAFLVVGIDMEKHLGAYKGHRQNAFLQAVYMLAAAVFTWGLGVSFLARREQARKAAALERFQAKLIDNLPDGLITLDAGLNIRAANPAAMNILRRASDDIVGKPVSALPEDIAKCAVAHGRADSPAGWQRVSSGSSHLEVLTLPLADDQENAFLLIIRDRTQLRSLEKSLADAEKLAAVGSLAAGVAHEVRNPLSSLRGFAQYFVKKLSGRAPEEEYARIMVREADRLNRVITDLLFLARPGSLAPKAVPLAPLLAEISLLLRFDLEGQGLQLHTELGAAEVFADEDILKQTLLNLILNSLDALRERYGDTRRAPSGRQASGEAASRQEGGSRAQGAGIAAPAVEALPQDALVVVSGRTGESAGTEAQSGEETGAAPGVWIEVRDKGCGMTQEQQARAFEAFFTAKQGGTGLGLSLVQRAMLDHGGSAAIISEKGHGCAVRLFFPDAR